MQLLLHGGADCKQNVGVGRGYAVLMRGAGAAGTGNRVHSRLGGWSGYGLALAWLHRVGLASNASTSTTVSGSSHSVNGNHTAPFSWCLRKRLGDVTVAVAVRRSKWRPGDNPLTARMPGPSTGEWPPGSLVGDPA